MCQVNTRFGNGARPSILSVPIGGEDGDWNWTKRAGASFGPPPTCSEEELPEWVFHDRMFSSILCTKAPLV
jgi:hypothetical protein